MRLAALKFNHIYSSAPWGGREIARHFGRTDVPQVCSESWEISGHRFGMSVVKDGPYQGRTLDELVRELGLKLVGTKSPTTEKFPLLFKLVDARWPLSLQIHPSEKSAPLTGGEPKTEAWYVIKAFPGAAIYAGLKHRFEERELREIVEAGAILLDQMNPFVVSEGDMMCVPGGMPHAIGGGCFVYEVQQASDTTYRFYDWDRDDDEHRPLRVEEFFKTLDYDLPPARVIHSGSLTTPFFSVRSLALEEPLVIKPDGTTFFALFVLSGSTDLASSGESVLIPATADEVVVSPTSRGTRIIVTTL